VKKTLAILVVLFVMICAFACAPEGEVKVDKTATTDLEASEDSAADEAFNKKYAPELPEHDFGGAKITFLINSGFWGPPDIEIEEITEELKGELVDEAAYRRNRNMEERYNFKINALYRDDAHNVAVREVKSGGRTYDAAFIGMYLAAPAAQQNSFIDLFEVPNINFDKYYWDQSAKEAFTIDKKLYFAVNDMSIRHLQATFILLYNKTVAENLGLEALYPLVFEGRWTMDKFAELSKNVSRSLTGKDKLGPGDFWAFATQRECYFAFLYGAGERFMDKDDADFPVLRPADEKLNNVVAKINGIMNQNNITINAHDHLGPNNEFVTFDIFNEDRALFFGSTTSNFTQFRNMPSDFGVLPMPKYDEAQKNYNTYVYHGATVAVIPNNLDENELFFAGFVLEALSAESRRLVIPAFYDITLKVKYSRDDESSQVLDLIFENRSYDLMYVNNFGGLRDDFESRLTSGNLNVMSLYESKEKAVQRAIDKYVDSFR